MRAIKLISILLILICAMLPLSKCSIGTELELEAEDEIVKLEQPVKTENVIFARKVFEGESSFWLLLTFIVPLMLSWHLYKKTEVSRGALVAQTIYCVWLVYFTYQVVYSPFNSPLWGGYILTTAALVYVAVTVQEWSKNITKRSS